MNDAGQFELDYTEKLPPAVQERIAGGMKQADQNADHEWKRVIDGCILAVARRQQELTVDDVLDEIDRVNVDRKAAGRTEIETHNLAALGPAMRRAATDEIIGRTDRVKRSTRDLKHGNRHNIWVSKYFASGEPKAGD